MTHKIGGRESAGWPASCSSSMIEPKACFFVLGVVENQEKGGEVFQGGGGGINEEKGA